jgi:hypothetical protein
MEIKRKRSSFVITHGKINTEPFRRHFEFGGCVSMGLCGQHVNKQSWEHQVSHTRKPSAMHKLMIVCHRGYMSDR